MNEMMSGLSVGLAVAIFVVFLVLTANFQSIRLALATVSTVPAVIAGVVLMLYLTQTTVNIQSFVGSIMAIGVAMANAILLVTFAETLRHEGRNSREAAVSGAASRLRAVLMTSCAMIAGMLPMALGLGESGQQNAPLGRAVIGGLAAATAATLFILPGIFAAIQRRATTDSASLDPTDPQKCALSVDGRDGPRRHGRNFMTRSVRFLGVFMSVGLLWAGMAGCQRAAPTAEAADKGSEPVATATLERVMVGQPERKTLTLSTTQPGRTEAFEETPLFGKLAGYVEQVLVDIGDKVSKHQVLVKIAIPEMQDDLEQKRALVAQAEAELKQAEAAVAGAKAAVKTADARIAQADAGVIRAKGEQERWNSEHGRMKELAETRSVPQKLVDETLNQRTGSEGAYREALANVRSSQALLEEARVNVQKAEADLGAAAARLRVAKAILARTTTLLEYTAIKAPYDGVVTRRLVATGDFVSPTTAAAAAQPILVVCRTGVVRIFVDVPELESEWVNDGDAAVVRVQALGGKIFDAKVTRNSWSVDPDKPLATRRRLTLPIPVASCVRACSQPLPSY